MHHYFINAKTIHNTQIYINMENRDISNSMHTHTHSHSHFHIYIQTNILSFLFNKLVSTQEITWMDLWIHLNWLKLNRITFDYYFMHKTHSLRISIINYRSNWNSFNCYERMCRTHKKKWSHRFIIFRWIAGCLADFICIISARS